MINEKNIYTSLIAVNVLVINIDLKSSLTELNGLVGERSLNKQLEGYWVLPSASWKHLSNPRQVQVQMVTPIAGMETADTLNNPWWYLRIHKAGDDLAISYLIFTRW